MKRLILQGISLALFFLSTSSYDNNYVEEIYKWKRVEYENLPKPANSLVGPYRYYIPENIDIMGMGYHSASGLMLVAVGRLRPGTPATAAAFCAKKYKSGSSPKLWAFPDYETNALRDSDFYNKLNRRKRKAANSQSNSDIDGRHYDQQKLTYQKPETTFLASSEKFRIISVYQMNVDEKCHRVFFVDVGVLDYFLNGTNVIQKPALLVYDLPPDG
uniref:Uncharacterized protein n=2 Tax=Phlebotomus papatasi TaxID=29031 RepID=A0A1B0D646_PHLPP